MDQLILIDTLQSQAPPPALAASPMGEALIKHLAQYRDVLNIPRTVAPTQSLVPTKEDL
jgi:hypothetical protein